MKYFLLLLPLISAASCNQKPLDASYDGDILIMTERDTKTNEHKITFDLSVPLYSIYWNPSNNQYYYVKDGSDLTKTNGLTYKLDPKKEEQIFVEDIKDPYLQFAGYLSTNERLYIDKRNKQQYIKVLIPTQDPIEVVPYKETYSDGSYAFTIYEEKPNIHQERFPRSPRTGNLPLGGMPT